jgi:hypothetical protein
MSETFRRRTAKEVEGLLRRHLSSDVTVHVDEMTGSRVYPMWITLRAEDRNPRALWNLPEDLVDYALGGDTDQERTLEQRLKRMERDLRKRRGEERGA